MARVVNLRLPYQPSSAATYLGSIPGGIGAGWCMLILRGKRQRKDWIATLRLGVSGGNAVAQEFALVQPSGWNLFGTKLGVVFLREGVTDITVRLYGASGRPGAIRLTLVPVPRGLAAVGVLLQSFSTFRASLRAVSGTLLERFRKAIAAAGIHGQQLPKSYANWIALFDAWPPEKLRQWLKFDPAGVPRISAVVFYAGHEEAALAATLESLTNQIYQPADVIVARAGATDTPATGAYAAVLQAGEVLPRHALLMMAGALARMDGPDILFADEDRVAPDGVRSDPLFKPQPNLTMMCSGVLSRGLWLIRSALLTPAAPSNWAECVRLEAWFGAHAAGRAGQTYRVPHVLTHRRMDAQSAPPDALATVVNRYLESAGIQARASSTGFPLQLRWGADLPGTLPHGRKVSIIVPSGLRGEVQVACLLDVLEKTTYSNFEMLVVVSQDAPLDPAQERAAARLRADPRARVELLRRPSFNYSLVNNFAASHTDGAFICLLNDDVSTLNGDWLDRMVCVFSDPKVAIAGAKLYYPNLTTQHGGVIMGLAGLAEHVNRFLPRGEPGYAWRGALDQEFSAVTGACLLVRREVYEEVGGLDESFPTAFNDVDFCLRVRQRGHLVVFAASVELIHHETLSFGHHYSNNTAQEAIDVRRMRERWPEVCETDPFHNPNLSLVGQSEWELAYPPRTQRDEAHGAFG